jgi:multiple sugar transport system permease protein
MSSGDNGKRVRARGPRGVAVGHVLAWLYALILILPVYYMLVSSFKDNIEIFSVPFALPTSLSLDNFRAAISQAQLGRALWNSVLVTVGAQVITLVLAVPAAYALARSRGRVATLMERFFALGFLIPPFAALVPTVLLAIWLGLFHTRTFLILFMPATVLPLSVIMLTQFMRAIPEEIEESAEVDGASRVQVLLHLYVPLTLPGIATISILNFLTFWNEYLFALVLTGPRASIRTVQVALPTLISQTATQFGVLMAGTMVALIPVYVAYIALNRRMEEAMLSGAVKG